MTERISGPRLAAQLAELVTNASDVTSFRRTALAAIQRAIGFDFATLHGSAVGSTGYALDADDLELTRAHHAWAAGLSPRRRRAPALSEGASACHQGSTLAQFASLSERLRIPLPSSMAARSWHARDGASTITLSRLGPVAAFGARELALLDASVPVISLGEVVLAITPARRDPFELWCDLTGLTPRQRQVAQLVTRGLRNAEIALILNCSAETIRNHLAAIFRKASVTNKAELTFQALSR